MFAHIVQFAQSEVSAKMLHCSCEVQDKLHSVVNDTIRCDVLQFDAGELLL